MAKGSVAKTGLGLHSPLRAMVHDREAMELGEWEDFALTHVDFPVGDLFGKILACTALLPHVLIIGLITLVLFRRDLHTIFYMIGVATNDLSNTILKRIFQEVRPMRRKTLYSQYGMPSSHAQMIWFFTAYAFLFLSI
ncbi:unnamed protein product, partial [Darwinula stevensoni]